MSYAWFVTPYKIRPDDYGPRAIHRYCSMDDHTDILDSWHEVEVQGDHGIVLAIGSDTALAQVAQTDKILKLPDLALHDKLGELTEQERSVLIDVMHGLGYTNNEINSRIRAMHDIRFAQYLNFLRTRRHKPGLNEDGELVFGTEQKTEQLPIQHLNAFPTNGNLDDFVRANGALGANWGADVFGNSAPVIFGNALTNGATSGTAYLGASWAANVTVGPDSELGITFTAVDGRGYELLVRMRQPGVSTTDGYSLFGNHNNSGSHTINRYDDGVPTQLGAALTQALANGDAMGVDIIGTTLQAHYKASGGSWANLSTSRTDSTYSAAGLLNLGWQEGSISNSHTGTPLIGGTTGVTSVAKTLSASYNVIKQISKTLGPSYTVKLAIPKTLTTSYNVKQQIAKTRSVSYNIITRVAKVLSASYAIGALPVNTIAPTITGSPLTGQLLTASTGTWTNSPTGYTYQWQVETAPGSGVYADIAGETASTLQL